MTFKNLMNCSSFHLISMICKLSVGKYMIMIRNVTNKIIKKMIKLISHYRYGVVVSFSYASKEMKCIEFTY